MQLFFFLSGFDAEFTKVYERLDIQRLVNRGESFYQEMMKNMVEDMDKKGFKYRMQSFKKEKR